MNKNENKLLNYLIDCVVADEPRVPTPNSSEAALHGTLISLLNEDGEVEAIGRYCRKQLNRLQEQVTVPLHFAWLLKMIHSGDWSISDPNVANFPQLNIDGQFGMKDVDQVWQHDMGAAGPIQEEFRPMTESCELRGDRVQIECLRSEIPHGLCRLYLVEPKSNRVTTFLPKLQLIEEKWHGAVSLFDILGRNPDQEVRIKWLQIANEESRDWFEADEVRKFVDGLNPQSDQRKLARHFLRENPK